MNSCFLLKLIETVVGLLPHEEVTRDYLKLCVDNDNSVANTKYVIEKMYKLNHDKIQKKKFSREFEDAGNLEQIW